MVQFQHFQPKMCSEMTLKTSQPFSKRYTCRKWGETILCFPADSATALGQRAADSGELFLVRNCKFQLFEAFYYSIIVSSVRRRESLLQTKQQNIQKGLLCFVNHYNFSSYFFFLIRFPFPTSHMLFESLYIIIISFCSSGLLVAYCTTINLVFAVDCCAK